MNGDLHIVAVSARTPIGLTAASAAAAVRAGVSRLAEHPFMVDDKGAPVVAALDPLLDPSMRGGERLAAMAQSPLLEIVSTLELETIPSVSVTCLVGMPDDRPGFGDRDAVVVMRRLEEVALPDLRNIHFERFGRGHASVLAAVAEARKRIESRRTELCIVGGVDSYMHHETLDWLQSHRQLANAEARSGFYPGEGAGFVALTSERVRRQYRWPSLAKVVGTGVATERKPMKADEDSFGEALTAAVVEAATPPHNGDGTIGEVYCDINGERYRGEEWGFVLLRASALFGDGTHYHCPAACWGDMGAASGALHIGVATEAWRRSMAGESATLVWGSSESGSRAALVLQEGERH